MDTKNDTVEIKDEDIVENDFTEQELADESIDWKAKATELKGIAKRRATQLKKAKDALKKEPTGEPSNPAKMEAKNSNKEFGLQEKTFLRVAGIVDSDEIELAKKIQQETGKDLDVLVDSKYFQAELKDLRDSKAITTATTGVKGGGGGTDAKNSADYWIAKGTPPTPDQVPDRKTRVNIIRKMMDSGKSGKKFYND